jgi:hypothetical protein
MCCALALGVACGGKLTLGNAPGDDAGTAAGGVAGTGSSVGVVSVGSGGTVNVGSGGTLGGTGVGGSAGDAGVSPCTVDLARIGCPATYGAALSPAICYVENPDHPKIATCGDLIIFEYGHDGSRTCIYDASANNLLGGTEWGGGTGISPSICPTINGGLTLPDTCKNLSFTACTVDAGLN